MYIVSHNQTIAMMNPMTFKNHKHCAHKSIFYHESMVSLICLSVCVLLLAAGCWLLAAVPKGHLFRARVCVCVESVCC